MEIWTEPQMQAIHKMLNPRSIAVVGATPRLQYGGRFLAAALKAQDRVRVYPVNPNYDEIQGVKSYPSVADLPEGPDLVGIVVPYDQVLDVLRGLSRQGSGVGHRHLRGVRRARGAGATRSADAAGGLRP